MVTVTRTYSTTLHSGVRLGVLHQEISSASGISPTLGGITAHPDPDIDEIRISFDTTLSSGELVELDTLLAEHTATETLAEAKARRARELARITEDFIESEGLYPPRRQRTLTKLQNDAAFSSNTVAYNYIQQGWDFAFQVMSHYYMKEAAINLAETVGEVNAVELELAQFYDHIPVSIATAIGLLQS